MTNFIYEREDYIERLKETVRKHEACNYHDYITLNELLDHIEAQGKQLRELNAAITKKNATIAKYENEKDVLQKSNSYLIKKVDELNNGIRDSEDLSWKQKYDALLHGSEQAIAALQKKCQEYKHSEDDATISAIETLSETNKKLEESNKRLMRQCDALRNENNELKEEVDLYIGLCNTKHEEVEALAKTVRCPWGNTAEIISAKTARIKELKRQLEDEKQVSKDLNVIINHKNKLLDEYMTKCDNLEHNYKEEFKRTCFNHEIKKLRYDNNTLRGRAKEISDLAETIVELCEEEDE